MRLEKKDRFQALCKKRPREDLEWHNTQCSA